MGVPPQHQAVLGEAAAHAGMMELMELKMIQEVNWVPTVEQLADCMTKRGNNSGWLLRVGSYNRLNLK